MQIYEFEHPGHLFNSQFPLLILNIDHDPWFVPGLGQAAFHTGGRKRQPRKLLFFVLDGGYPR